MLRRSSLHKESLSVKTMAVKAWPDSVSLKIRCKNQSLGFF